MPEKNENFIQHLIGGGTTNVSISNNQVDVVYKHCFKGAEKLSHGIMNKFPNKDYVKRAVLELLWRNINQSLGSFNVLGNFPVLPRMGYLAKCLAIWGNFLGNVLNKSFS